MAHARPERRHRYGEPVPTPPNQDPLVVLVDETNHEVGVSDKLAAHQPPALLHRAVSVLLHDDLGRILLQRRSPAKYHFAGLWANTACGHPMPGESVESAARRRLAAELRTSAGPLTPVGAFVYQAVDPVSGLMEHELDHVLVGPVDGSVEPVPEEVAEVRWCSPAEVAARIEARPETVVPWLALVLPYLGMPPGR